MWTVRVKMVAQYLLLDLISLIEKKKSRRENASSAFLVVVRIFPEELQCSSWQIQKSYSQVLALVQVNP